VAETPKPTEVVDEFREALNKLITSDPEAANKIMAAVMGVASEKPRKVEEKRRTVEIPKQELPNLEPLPPPPPGVVFASRHGAFRFVLRRGGSQYDAMGNKEIVPPVLLDFDGGLARVTEPSDIARLRAFIVKQRRQGIEPQVVELRDEIAEEMEAGRKIEPIQSQRVTVDTPLAELVTA
jgi:hypothetical protein